MKIAVFGYGSLVNPKSLSRTLGNVHDIKPALLRGWRRDWSAILENDGAASHYVCSNGDIPKHVAVLNIRPDSQSVVNGILIPCRDKDFDNLVDREVHYSVVDVTDSIEDGSEYDKIYSFTAKPQFTDNENSGVIIPKSYVDLVEEAFKTLGDNQIETYLKTTFTPSDRIRPTIFII